MTQIVEEGELQLTFPESVGVERMDRQGSGHQLPQGMAFVDFAIEEHDRVLLLEIKDPAQSGAPPAHVVAYLEAGKWNALVCDRLVPKARDSYTFLHLMARDAKPFTNVVLLGTGTASVEPALLLNLRDTLAARLRQEADEPWKRPYVTDCVVATEQTWSKHFPNYQLARTVGV